MTEPSVQFDLAKPKRAFDHIIDQVRQRLLSGELKPGEKLPSEREFAIQLGVSRNTVREALRMLEIAGLVTLKKGHTGGAFVADASATSVAVSRGIQDGLTLTEYSFRDLTEARIGLESMIVRFTCERATEDDINDLERLVEEAEGISSRENWPKKVARYLDFHMRLTAAARNPVLELLIAPIHELTSEIVLRVGPTAENTVWDSRQRLLAALRSRDGDAAVAEVNSSMEQLYFRWVRYDASTQEGDQRVMP